MELLARIKEVSLQTPHQLAFRHHDETLTYGELWNQSERLASYLLSKQLSKNTPVLVYGHMSPNMLISFLGAVKAGHPYIPVDTSIPMERIESIMKSAQASMMMTTEELTMDHFDVKPEIILSVDMMENIKQNHEITVTEEQWVSDDDNFYIIYTSGSTGNPKGVQISANNLQSFVDWMLKDFALLENSVYLNQAPFSFDLSVMDLYPALATGSTLFAISKEMIANPKELFVQFAQSNMGVWTSTPSFAQICLTNPAFNEEMLPKLEAFLFCGEVLSSEVAQKLLQRFPKAKVYNLYGPTEATVAVSMIDVTPDLVSKYTVLPIGYCKEDCEILVVDENGQKVAPGEMGEMIIVGPSVSKGYLGEPTLTEKVFFDLNGKQAYRTGDVGYEENGLFFYKGRIDYQVKVHGYRMELEEIEIKLAQSQYVQNCAVIPVYKGESIDFLAAYIVAAPHTFEKDYQLSSAIKKDLAKLLPAYMIPRKYVYVNDLPITPNGKLDRKRLKQEVEA